MIITTELTKKGYPALWEEGGGYSNTGRSRIITGPKGERLTPVYIRRRGRLACEEHALFIVKEGCHIISASHHRADFNIHVFKILSAKKDYNKIEVEEINSFSMGEWDEELPEYLEEPVKIAKEKALRYHCREALYIALK
ncbi:MAG: hypothetical protein ACP6IQ_01860 [Candidatus Njordarchaeia archaeon]